MTSDERKWCDRCGEYIYPEDEPESECCYLDCPMSKVPGIPETCICGVPGCRLYPPSIPPSRLNEDIMIDEEDELAFRLFTADTANASRVEWNMFGNRDKYLRMAKAAINYIRYDEGTRMKIDGALIGQRL